MTSKNENPFLLLASAHASNHSVLFVELTAAEECAIYVTKMRDYHKSKHFFRFSAVEPRPRSIYFYHLNLLSLTLPFLSASAVPKCP